VRRNVLEQMSGAPLRAVHGIYTRAPQMDPLLRLVERAARTDCTVLVRGETGSGKELVARAIHACSARARKPFLAINCATLSPTLLESELFGHVRGAFTGAISDHDGLFKRAHGGTLFLDEIAEMPLDIQARLLRILEDRTFVPLGGTRPVRCDVRLVSATHRALREECAAGRFREDLRYRIRVVPLFLPPLRERTGDVEALVWHFVASGNEGGLRRVDGVRRVAMEALVSYPWPGNVRELRNVIEYAYVVGDGPILELDDLTPELRGEPPPGIGLVQQPVERERSRILAALDAQGGHKGRTAHALGMSRSTLWRKLYQLGLEAPRA